MNDTWNQIRNNLQNKLKSGIFQVWIKPLQAEFKKDQLVIKAPNEFVASWVQERLVEEIQTAALEVLGFKPELELLADKESNSKLFNPKSQTQEKLPVQYTQPKPKTFNWRYKFEDFVVGNCNQLAYTACTSICSQDFPAGNIFVCSDPGLGKTHLLHAIGNFVCQAKQRQNINVAYLSSEKFATQMVQALKAGEINKFKAKYRDTVDLLLLEDIHFFQGKEKMQAELLSLIKALEEKNSKVVFSSTFLPKELHKIDNQLTSHFCSGVLAPIQRPDFEFILKLIRQKAKNLQIDIPMSISEYVASNIKRDIRQIESCIRNMAIKARLLKQKVTMELAEEVVQNYCHTVNTPNMQQILNFVTKSFDIPEQKLRSRSRKKQIVLARNTAFYLARKHTGLSLKNIGEHFNRKHSTVIKGITSVEREISKDTNLGRQLMTIVKRME